MQKLYIQQCSQQDCYHFRNWSERAPCSRTLNTCSEYSLSPCDFCNFNELLTHVRGWVIWRQFARKVTRDVDFTREKFLEGTRKIVMVGGVFLRRSGDRLSSMRWPCLDTALLPRHIATWRCFPAPRCYSLDPAWSSEQLQHTVICQFTV